MMVYVASMTTTTPRITICSSTIMLVLMSLLLLPVTADIFVMDADKNETRAVFEDLTAAFGPLYPKQGIMGRIVYATPPDACAPVEPPPGPTQEDIGWILLIARGGVCQFADKVLAAQQKGYDSVIIHNYEGKEDLVKMYGNENGSFINIPSTFVGFKEGVELRDLYNYKTQKYYIKIVEDDSINYKLYLWPFIIVVAVCFILVMVFVIVKFLREHASRRLNRLSKKHLKKIPVRKYKKGDYYDTCAICLDEYEEGEKIRVLPCDHVYHTKCIDPWLTKNKKTCPVCKRRVMPGRDADDDDSDSDGNAGGSSTIPDSSERTPLLFGSGGSAQSSRESGGPEPRYSARTLRVAGNEGGRAPTSTSSQSSSSSSPPSTSAVHATNPGSGQALVAGCRHARSMGRAGVVTEVKATVPTVSDGAHGAVGGAGISEQYGAPEIAGIHSSREHSRRKRRRGGPVDEEAGLEQGGVHNTESNRGGRRGENTAMGNDLLADAGEERVTETKEERRERRRRKKEKKRRTEELKKRASEEAGQVDNNVLAGLDISTEGTSRESRQVQEEGQFDTVVTASVDGHSDVQESGSEAKQDETQGGGEETNEEGRFGAYVNHSYSESQEVVLPSRSRRHEMNDMV